MAAVIMAVTAAAAAAGATAVGSRDNGSASVFRMIIRQAGL